MTQVAKTTRFWDYIRKYDFIISCIADLHLDGSPLILHEKEVEAAEYFERLIEPLQESSMIVLLGDTIDRTSTTNFRKAKKQLHTLYEILDKYKLIEKTVIILGNHDYDARYFIWRKPLLIRPFMRLSLYPYRDVVIHHGDNFGLEPLIKNPTLAEKAIKQWRKDLKRKVDDRFIRGDDILILGHTHRGYCNRKDYILAVPSVRKILESSSNAHLGYIGMFCFSAEDDLWDWNIAIEAPVLNF